MFNFHAYVSDSLKTVGNRTATVCAWNTENDLIACGQDNGIITISKLSKNTTHKGIFSIKHMSTLSEHKSTILSLSWNTAYSKLVSSDFFGKIIVWVESSDKWVPLLINDVQRTPIISALNSPNSELISILYENGKIICGNIAGNQKWKEQLQIAPTAICWASNSRNIYVASTDCDVYYLKDHATNYVKLDLDSIDIDKQNDKIISLQWNKKYNGYILILYRFGTIVIHKEYNETVPIIIDCECEQIYCGTWFNDGNSFVIACRKANSNPDRSYLMFYTKEGELIRTLDIKAMSINSISVSKDNTNLCLALDNTLTIIQIVPNIPWTYFKDTIVYSIPSSNTDAMDTISSYEINSQAKEKEKQEKLTFDNDHQNTNQAQLNKTDYITNEWLIIYFNTKTGEKHVKTISDLKSIASSDTKCVLLSQTETKGAAVILTNEKGIPFLDNYISFKPCFVALTESFCVIASNMQVCIWNLTDNSTRFVTYESEITAIAAKGEKLFIAFSDLALIGMNIVSLAETERFTIKRTIESIEISSDSTRISCVDTHGFLVFLDIHSGNPHEVFRKETWCCKWATDSPNLFAALEKQKIYLYKDFEPIGTVYSMSNICEFKDLHVLLVDFVKLFNNPIEPTLECFNLCETKPLHDISLLLQSLTELQQKQETKTQTTHTRTRIINKEHKDESEELLYDILNYVNNLECPYAWNKMAEYAIKHLNFHLAEKCFSNAHNKEGLLFLKQLNTIKEKDAQKAYSMWFIGEVKEAIELLTQNKRFDLLLSIYRTDKDFREQQQDLAKETQNEAEFLNASQLLAHQYFIEGNWKKASIQYRQAKNISMLLECLFNSDDHKSISDLIEKLPRRDPLLLEIGKKFLSLGSPHKASEAFLKYGSPQLAADGYAYMNMWRDSIRTAKKYPQQVNKKEILSRFAQYLAENSYVAKSIKTLIYCGLFEEAAINLEKEGDKILKQGINYLLAKKLYVFSCLLKMKHLKGAKKEEGRANRRTTNESTLENKETIEKIWKKAEAVHYFLLAHRFLFEEKYEDCIYVASRVLRVYSDVINPEISAALLAISGYKSGYLQRCSVGLAQLENSQNLSKKKKQRAEQLSIKIFMKNEPNDPYTPEPIRCPHCNKGISPFYPRCRCGYILPCSIFSGKTLNEKSLWTCPFCMHKGSVLESKQRHTCPLCHNKY